MQKIKKRYFWIALVAVILSLLFFCAVSFASAFGYKQALSADLFQKAALVSQEAVTPLVIILDAGHGGEDPGAVCGQYNEKDLNLAITEKTACFFSLSGYDLVLTRSTDKLLYEDGQEDRKKFYDLRNRLRIAQSYPGSVFISIHMNQFPEHKYHGLQVFYSEGCDESRVLAQTIQDNARLLDSSNERQIKPEGSTIFLLENLQNPAVLIECGFLSNSEEAAKLSDKDYQNRLAFIFFCAAEVFCAQYQAE